MIDRQKIISVVVMPLAAARPAMAIAENENSDSTIHRMARVSADGDRATGLDAERVMDAALLQQSGDADAQPGGRR